MENQLPPAVAHRLESIVGADRLLTGDVPEAYGHDEALELAPVQPTAVIFPETADEVVQLVRMLNDERTSLTARGSGTGLAGGARPTAGSIVCSFERMSRILSVDPENQTATLEPGVTLAQLEAALADTPFFYPVYPGEMSASLGGNVATNAGGMRAVKYGVTRHNVLGLHFVTGTATLIRSGGAYVKTSSGYDLTQLVIGSEGTLALVTEVLVRLSIRPLERALLLASFPDFTTAARVVPRIAEHGLSPSILEYVDASGLQAMANFANIRLGIAAELLSATGAYLMIEIEAMDENQLDHQASRLVEVVAHSGSTEQYLLSEPQSSDLIRARESAFWAVKAMGAATILDTVVPRASLPSFFDQATTIAQDHGVIMVGTGHVGDGNVHFSLFSPDRVASTKAGGEIVGLAYRLGGAVSGEHGIGVAKLPYLLQYEDPNKVALQRSIRSIFDPNHILNPGSLT